MSLELADQLPTSPLDYKQIALMEKKKSSVEDYPIVKELGKGAFGLVFLVKGGSGLLALKKIAKQQLVKSGRLYQAFMEKEVLLRLDHPGIIKMYDTFSDSQSIYLVVQYCQRGELKRIMRESGLSEKTRRHYIAEIVSMLEYLKEQGVTHRDLKSSNLLVTEDGHLKLMDFGCAYAGPAFLGEDTFQKVQAMKKMGEEEMKQQEEGNRRATFVGTPYYMSPEILKESICDYAADLWALGCLVYEMYVGNPPFTDADEYAIFKKIQEQQLTFPPETAVPEDAKALIVGLLTKDKNKRLGCGSADSDNSFKAIKNHPYFNNIDFEGLFSREVPDFKQLSVKMDQCESPKKKENRYLISGIVEKKMFLGNYKERQMALLSDPKLIYFDEETGEKKGEIQLNINTPIELDGHKFTVTGKKKKYFFKAKKEEHGHSACEWVQKMKQAISKAFY